MLTFNEFLTFEHDLEHDLEHDSAHKRDFSPPKIYTANGDLSKRWYVYFSFRDPKTNKLKRQKNIYGNANTYKTKEDRFALLSRYRRRLLKLLQQGYNPNINNTELYKVNTLKSHSANTSHKTTPNNNTQIDDQNITPIQNTIPNTKPNTESSKQKSEPIEEKGMTLREAFDYSLKLKENQISPRSLKDYEYTTNALVKWVAKNCPDIKTIDQFDKKVASNFLNSILMATSSRNRNNYRLNLSSLCQVLENNDIIPSNPLKKIDALRSIPKRNKSYTSAEHKKIFEYLKKEDPLLLLYIKFISYNFLRPVEVCRLKIKDINIEDQTLQFKAKNSPLKTKLIPQKIINELPDLSKLDPEFSLFTPIKIGGAWETSETNKTNYFSKRYKIIVKDHFKLDKDQTLYSFRHTFISILYHALLKGSSTFAAKSKLMEITGHTTMTALDKYLRGIDAKLPEDYSDLL